MAELVRVIVGDSVKNVAASFARKHGLKAAGESPRKPDGTLRREARANGRPMKKKTSVDRQVTAKKAAAVPPHTEAPSTDGGAATAEEATE